MSQDGVSTVAGLKIEIDSDTQKFANGVTATREQLAAFVNEGNPLLKGFDATFGALGNTIGGLPAKITAAMGALAPMLTLANWLIGQTQALAEKVGANEQFNSLKSSVTGLTGTLSELGITIVSGPAQATEQLRQQFGLAKEQSTALDEQFRQLAQKTIVELTGKINDLDAAIAGAFKAADKQTTQQLEINIARTKSHLKELEQTATVTFRNAEAFGTAFGEAITTAGANVEKLREYLESLDAELTKRRWAAVVEVNDPADIQKTIDALQKQNEALDIQRETLGMAAGAAAEYAARKKLAAETGDKPVSETQLDAFDDEVDRLRRNKQAMEDYATARRHAAEEARRQEQQEKGVDRLNEGMDAEIAQIDAKRRALSLGTAAAAEEVFVQKQLHAARRANIELTDADIAGIRAAGHAYGEATRELKAMQDQLEMVKATGQAVSSALDQQFVAWTNGAAFNVKKMEQQILASFANLILQRNVLGPLFGGYGTEGGGLFGNALSSFFGGFKAEGGPVSAGVPYVVGEKGPELFVPTGAGAIVPNQALGGGTVVHLNIDARGATPDAVAALRGELPGIVMQTMHDARERGAA